MFLFDDYQGEKVIKYADLFCGIGGFRIAANQVFQENLIQHKCVFSSDIDPYAQKTYQANFQETPQGDITQIIADEIPDHNLLFAGFPCQPFSICGDLKGFEDTRGTLFFEIARILSKKHPYAFILENVKQLVGHQEGKTLKIIISTLEDLGYSVYYKVLNALDFGLPQKRERIFIIGCLDPLSFKWEQYYAPLKPLGQILEKNVSLSYYASDKIQKNRLEKYAGKPYNEPTIWHENKAGHISAYPYSCAMRAGASYNYLLVNGQRRLTEREMLRLQGFPDSFKFVGSYTTTRKLVGNSVAIPCVLYVLRCLLKSACNFKNHFSLTPNSSKIDRNYVQLSLFNKTNMDLQEAKTRLDLIMKKSRTRFYKPIQIAETLYHSRVEGSINILDIKTYRTSSIQWRDQITTNFYGHHSTSSSRYQDDIWNNHAMPPHILNILDQENKQNLGLVETYIYSKFIERQGVIAAVIEKIKESRNLPKDFYLKDLLSLFRKQSEIKRNIDKCYEIITYSLFETIIRSLKVQITVKVPQDNYKLLEEFQDLTKVLLNVGTTQLEWTELAHIYRVGVTNTADRGLDMWSNFGPAIQVKHLTLKINDAEHIVDQVESDHIVIVCRDADAKIIEAIMKQIGWGQRVRGIVTETQLEKWYNNCLRGQFTETLSPLLFDLLIQSFENEFPEATDQATLIEKFCQSRGYSTINLPEFWKS